LGFLTGLTRLTGLQRAPSFNAKTRRREGARRSGNLTTEAQRHGEKKKKLIGKCGKSGSLSGMWGAVFRSAFFWKVFFIVYQRVPVCTERVRIRGMGVAGEKIGQGPLSLDGGALLIRILWFAYTIHP
jgi:hypothetical protein